MVSVASPLEALIQTQARWEALGDPVRRLEALRSLFRALHHDLNSVLLQPEHSSAARQLEYWLDLLNQATQTWEGDSSSSLRTHFMQSSTPQDCLQRVRESTSDCCSPEPSIPLSLTRKDRIWERLLWRVAMTPPSCWIERELREQMSLQEFAQQSSARSQELEKKSLVLFVQRSQDACSMSGPLARYEWTWYLLEERKEPLA
ncbi:MAG: hypothetical protein RJB38_1833 [Pseudomonadota bacterium]|jgi:hypothetical protein